MRLFVRRKAEVLEDESEVRIVIRLKDRPRKHARRTDGEPMRIGRFRRRRRRSGKQAATFGREPRFLRECCAGSDCRNASGNDQKLTHGISPAATSVEGGRSLWRSAFRLHGASWPGAGLHTQGQRNPAASRPGRRLRHRADPGQRKCGVERPLAGDIRADAGPIQRKGAGAISASRFEGQSRTVFPAKR